MDRPYDARGAVIEVYISRDLALKIGCIIPSDVQHHRELKKGIPCLLVRDTLTLDPMFWPIVPALAPSS
jgi:hypothetical protein